jgi:hypothetical protein
MNRFGNIRSYLSYIEQEVLEGFVIPGGATCRFYESETELYAETLQPALTRLALGKKMVVTEIELSDELPLHDWKQITTYILVHMCAEINGVIVQSLPEILFALAECGQPTACLLQNAHVPHPGFRNAMLLACSSGEMPVEAKRILSNYLLGNKVTVRELREAGLHGVRSTLTHKNAERVLQTVISCLGLLQLPGSLIQFIEKKDHLSSKRQGSTERMRVAANLIRRLVDGCHKGVLNSTLIVMSVIPGFLEKAADAYPALGQRLQIVKGGVTRPAWRFPIVSLAQLLQGGIKFEASPLPPAGDAADPTDRLDALTSLEALRFGLVPQADMENLTVGIDELKSWILSTLPREERPGVHLVSGPFGTGKSHALNVIRHYAMQEGYICAAIELDGLSISLSEPGQLLYALCQSLSAADDLSEFPIVRLFEKALDCGHNVLSFPVRSFSKIKGNMETIQTLRRFQVIDHFAAILESLLSCGEDASATEVSRQIVDETGLKPMQINLNSPIGKNVNDRPRDFLETVAGYALLSQMCGYKGLVVTVDEFEVETHADRARFERIISFLRELLRYMEGNHPSIPNAPLSVYFAAVGKHTEGDAFLERLIALAKGKIYRLNQWTDHQRMGLAEKLYEVYAEAYDIAAPYDSELAENVNMLLQKRGLEGSTLIRSFVKWYVAMLDMKYGPPGLTVR